MAIETIINDAGIVTTVISFITFIGILWWTFGSSAAATSTRSLACRLPTTSMKHRN